ncbi:uncharacterized protein LOC132755777 isoform X2 [Ruditapes philippinarum]|uniref:uncharacterized protein LOC132755777 isoform X1 n=1 Tax=Ruditapes philippinarum TaxID=129788 RepID=UPI00295B7D03|nr:uncharacterized protein LOC132755777 isoform X1 [Ruditapes philippinarum]XP_060602676.1 uncharacterized protein LOC132755777 isoform X1 [Ruditapes philippinarum]XP_060602678.1 uncharacterized protein LOC132755777 isoform X2 [Ruditapes philippinarum]
MSENISRYCEPCINGRNVTVDAKQHCTDCEESYCENCSAAHKAQKATRNHKLTDIEEFLDNNVSLSKYCEPCLENGVSVEAVARCEECIEFYCENCARIHKSQKATRSHEITTLDVENKRCVCEACSYNGDEDRPSSAMCVTCDEVLCFDCTKAHRSQKATRAHQIENQQDTSKASPRIETGRTSSARGTYCDRCNEDSRLTPLDQSFWFCFSCRQTLCDSCANDHKQSAEGKSHRLIYSSDTGNGDESQADKVETPKSSSSESIPDEISNTDAPELCGCCVSNENEIPTGTCLDCNKKLCSTCVDEHMLLDETNKHRLIFNDENPDHDSMTDDIAESKISFEPEPEITGIKQVNNDICQLCQGLGTQSPVVAFCFDCLKTLCESCHNQHMIDDVQKFHKIMSRNEDKQSPEKENNDKNKSEEPIKEEVKEEITPNTKPGKPKQVGALNVDSVTITWSAPTDTLDSSCYQIRYKENKHDAKWQYYDEDKPQHTTLTVRNLKSHSCFVFQVRLVNNEEEGPYSEVSDPIETLPSAAELVFDLSEEVFAIGDQLKLRKFRLNENLAAKNHQLKTRKFTLGEEKAHHQKEKTVLLLGASGTGKTTFVNGLINYLFGVTFADDFRFSIVAAEDNEPFGKVPVSMGGLPKTEWITCYNVVPVKGSKVDFRLTIIDTPGFGDKGIEKDAEIKDQLKELFSAVDEKGVLFVDAVCIFMRASESRLTITQEYIYTTITSLFHRDIQENICSIVTFSDGKAPPVLAALKEANLPYETYFPFNTSEIFSDNIKTSQTSLTKVFFDMNVSSFDAFMLKLSTMKTKSLSQSTEVIEKRRQIEETAGILLSQVEKGLNKMEECRSEIAILEKFKTQMTDNKDFRYKRKKHVQNLIPLRKGLHTTNCLHCNVTCHDNCIYENDEDKAMCTAMNENGYCKVCDDHCYWDKHKNTPFIIEWKEVEEECTYDEMMNKYKKAEAEVTSHEGIVNKLKKELDEAENDMLNLMKEIADCSNQLSQIALRANPLSVAEHIDIIIENEKWERKPGFQDRINNLENLKKKIAIGDEFKHFQKSKEDIYK